MKNLIRVQRFPELDQTKLIHRDSLDQLPGLETILSRLSEYVDRIDSDDGGGVNLGVVFTNIYSKRSARGRLTWVVYPTSPEKVRYVIKKGDFWFNQGDDPVKIMNQGGIFLFSKNPFINLKQYHECLKYILFAYRSKNRFYIPPYPFS